MVNNDQNFECELCNEFSGGRSNSFNLLFSADELSTRVLARTKHFLVIVGLGAMTEGYLLIVPKTHYLSVGHIATLEQFIELEMVMAGVRKISEEILDVPYVFFEHGTLSSSKRAGGCIDHAHIHAVPLSGDINFELDKSFAKDKFQCLQYLSFIIQSGNPYLFLEDQESIRYAYKVSESIPSQYIRRIWASIIGKPNEWDWSVFVGKKSMVSTYQKLIYPFRQNFAKHIDQKHLD